MIRKAIASVLFISIAAVPGSAADGDNAAPLPTEPGPSAAASPSYFHGVWVGSWPSFMDPSKAQDITIAVDRGKGEGVHEVTYTWEMIALRRGIVPSGSVRTRGSEQGEEFHFKWKNKQGREFEITLQKHKDDEVKARIDRSGPYGPNERPFTETYLKRRK